MVSKTDKKSDKKPKSSSKSKDKLKKSKTTQVIKSSKGQNIQIQIDLSKKRTTAPQRLGFRQSTDREVRPERPIINIPQPVYGMTPQTNVDNSMFQAINQLIAQNKRYELMQQKQDQKVINPITKEKELKFSPSLGDEVNKTTSSIELPQLYGTQLEQPEEEEKYQYEEQPEEEEEEEEEVLGGGGGGIRGRNLEERQRHQRLLKLFGKEPKEKPLRKMSLEELQSLSIEEYEIYPYTTTYIKKGKNKGQPYDKPKTKKQIIQEIEHAKKKRASL